MKKNDNKINLKLYCIIASKDNLTFKTYFQTYEKFQKELKYYILMGYCCQVEMLERVYVV